MTKAVKVDGDWVVMSTTPVTVAGLVISAAWLDGMAPEELALFGIEAADVLETEPPALPPGLRAVAGVEDVEGSPIETWSIAHITDEALSDALVAAVTVKRDQRIQGGFLFEGDLYQSRPDDQLNISGMGVQAQLAVGAGALEGDLRWADPEQDFRFIRADNTTRVMDAQTMVALFLTGMAFKRALVHAARAKKDWLLDPARTRAELLAFDVNADWPV